MLTSALGAGPSPGAVDGAVPAQHPRGIKPLPALVDDGAGEHQAVVEDHPGIAGRPGVPTGDHWEGKWGGIQIK